MRLQVFSMLKELDYKKIFVVTQATKKLLKIVNSCGFFKSYLRVRFHSEILRCDLAAFKLALNP
jgi:hypothetical protein